MARPNTPVRQPGLIVMVPHPGVAPDTLAGSADAANAAGAAGAAGATGATGATAFVDARAQSTSHFPLSVSTASYQSLRRDLAAGHLPDAKTVRIDELVNAFAYHYAAPTGTDAFGVDLEAAACPWDVTHRLIRIGLQARPTSPGDRPLPVACDATASVEFDPTQTSAYRLLGYTRTTSPPAPSPSGCNVMPGQQITALYEVIPATPSTTAPTTFALLTLHLNYRRPADLIARQEQMAYLLNFGNPLPQSTPDFQFAAAVADFGLALQEDATHHPERFDRILQLSAASLPTDADGSRGQFIQLVKRARELSKA